jgi:DNA-binding transcriptional LysR family regulator
LAAAVARDAPGVNLNLRPSGTLDLADRLDHGEIDVALGGLAASGERFRDVRLFTDQFAALVIHNHPGACDGRINLQALAAYPHLILSSTGQESDFLDAELSKCGLERRIALRAPLLTAAAMLAQSDLIAVVARRAGEVIARSAGLSVVDLPFPTPTLTTAMVWHRRVNDLAPHRWLRGIIQREARALRVNANRHSTT